MFANMQRIAVALLVVAFVPARVLSEEDLDILIEGYVSDLYSATDHTLVGSFNYTDAGNWLDVYVDKALHFTSKYPYVAITLHRAEDVSPTCRISGPALINREGNPLVIYSGKDTGILDKSNFNEVLQTSLLPNVKSTIVNAGVAMYSANAEDPKLSPIACGKIRHFTIADDFLEGFNNKITEEKPTDLPSTSDRQISPVLLLQFEAVTDLYSSNDGGMAGSIIYQTFDRNSLEVGVLDFSNAWYGATAVAVVYQSRNVMPGCVTTGPAVSIRDEHNVTRPVILLMDQIDTLRRPIYGNMVDYASVSPRSVYDIMGHVVVVYAFEPSDPIVLEDFLQPTNPHNSIACGAIRSADASEDNFLKWAPAGPKPTSMSETKKWARIIDSLVLRFRQASMTA